MNWSGLTVMFDKNPLPCLNTAAVKSFPHTAWCTKQTLASHNTIIKQAGGSGGNMSLVLQAITLFCSSLF